MPPEDPSPGDGYIEIDALTALGTAMSRPDGRIATLADAAGGGPLLVVVAEYRCPVCTEVLRALRPSNVRLAVVSQGRPEAARALVQRTGLDERDVLVEPAPHRVSDALAATAVPTFVLIEGLEPVAWQDGWDPSLVGPLVRRAGGDLGDRDHLPATTGATPSRLTLDEQARLVLETEDARLPSERPD